MSFAVTSSITWWFLSPLIAENMPRIMRASLLGSRDLRDRGRVDTLGAADGEDGAAVLLGDLLDDARVGHVGLVVPGHGAADQADGLAELEVRGHRLVGAGQVGDLLERRERRHLAHEVLVLH